MREDEIISQIKKGDETALDYLYKKNYRSILKMVMSNKGSEEEAKDIYQEAVIIFWQKAMSNDFVLTSKISTYIYAICRNLWRKELERKNKSAEKPEESEENDFDKKERIAIINDCINSLGQTCKEVLSYYYFDGMSMQEIAQKMGFANADTAKTKKYKCKKQLDQLIKSKYKATDFLD